jgi:hypothetical protein
MTTRSRGSIGGEFAEKRIAGAVHERAASGDQPVDAEEQRAIESGGAGVVGLRVAERIGGTRAVQQFVAVDRLLRIEDRLAREKFLHEHLPSRDTRALRMLSGRGM